MICHRLSPGTYHELSALGRTPDPERWIEEVEEFLFVDVPAQRGAANGSVALLVLEEGVTVAAAAHRPHARFLAEHLQALVVPPDKRGAGLAEPALRAVIEHLHTELGQHHVIWHVHVENAPMRTISGRVGDEVLQDGDYLVFIHP